MVVWSNWNCIKTDTVQGVHEFKILHSSRNQEFKSSGIQGAMNGRMEDRIPRFNDFQEFRCSTHLVAREDGG